MKRRVIFTFGVIVGVMTILLMAHTMSPTVPIFPDSIFSVYDNNDADRLLAFEVGNISNETKRTWTARDASGTVIISGDTFTGDVTATLDSDGSTALTVVDNSHDHNSSTIDTNSPYNGDDANLCTANQIYDWVTGLGYITATLTQEQVEDYAGGLFTGNTETLITATYQVADNTLDLVVDNDLHNYSWSNVVDSDITDTLTSSTCTGNAATATTAGTVTTAAQPAITSVGTLTSLDVNDINVGGKTTTQTFKMTTGPTEGYVMVTDADGEGTWQYIGTTTYKPYDANTGAGTPTVDDANLLKEYDNDPYIVTEAGGAAPVIDVNIYFADVEDISQIITRVYYEGSASHHILVQLWDWDGSAWEDYWDFVGQSGYTVITIPVFDAEDHIGTGGDANEVRLRFHHVQSGIASHTLSIDFAWLQAGEFIGASTDLSGYARYEFGYNDFNGVGDFTTTGDVNAATVYATSSFIGDLTGNVTGNASTATTAGTVTTAAQGAITSVGTLTNLDVDNININGNTMTITGNGFIDAGQSNITLTADEVIIPDLYVNNSVSVGTLYLDKSGSITDSSGAISFGNENLTTTGTIAWSGGGSANANTAYTHANGSTGADHTYLDQSVVSGATPTFTGTNFTGIPSAGVTGLDTHTALNIHDAVADESADTTCFPLFVTAATGDLAPKTDASFTYNASTEEMVVKFLEATVNIESAQYVTNTGYFNRGSGNVIDDDSFNCFWMNGSSYLSPTSADQTFRGLYVDLVIKEATHDITAIYGVEVDMSTYGSAPYLETTIGNVYGIKLTSDFQDFGAGDITNNYGLWIDAASNFSANNYAIHVADGNTLLLPSFSTVIDGDTDIPLYIDSTGLIGPAVSSLRYKENITPAPSVKTSKIYDLTPIEFNWIGGDTKKREIGLTAEAVAEAYPEMVWYKRILTYPQKKVFVGGIVRQVDDHDQKPVITFDTNTPEGVKYNELIVPMLAEMQIMKTKYDAEIASLKDRVAELEKGR